MLLFITRFAPDCAVIVSLAVTGTLTALPLTSALFVIVEPGASGANWFTVTSYTIIAFPSAGTEIPLTVSGGPAVTVGVA